MGILNDLGISVGNNNSTARVFENLFPDFFNITYQRPSQYILKYWAAYERHPEGSQSMNGKIFEYILATLFVREQILPLFLNAKVAFVPNVIYDLMIYTREKGPICISAKTSLRERYKQADLESIALKYVHRKALSYLVTLDKNEAASVREKIKSGDVIGLDEVIVASSADFDKLIKALKDFELADPPTVQVIQSNQIVTAERVQVVRNN